MTQIKVLVFDLDDTLFPEREFVYGGFRAVGDCVQHQFGITGFFEVTWDLFDAGQRRFIFNQTLDHFGLSYRPTLIQDLVQVYRHHQPQITLFPDAKWALDFYQSQLLLGLITNGYLKTQQNKVSALGIGHQFTSLMYCDRFGRHHWKPSPLAYQKLMVALGCKGCECVYIGDYPEKDFIGPKQLAWHTLRVQRAGGEFADMDAATGQDADGCVSSLYDLKPFLETL